MSVKVNDGLKLTAPVENFFGSVDKVREICSEIFFTQFFDTLPEGVEDYEHWNEVHRLFVSPWDCFEKNNFGYRVAFFKGGLVLIESNSDDYKNALIANGVVTDYGYWDNVEEPENMDPFEWAQRKFDWELAIDEKAFGTDRGVFLEYPSRMDTCLKNIDMKASKQRSFD